MQRYTHASGQILSSQDRGSQGTVRSPVHTCEPFQGWRGGPPAEGAGPEPPSPRAPRAGWPRPQLCPFAGEPPFTTTLLSALILLPSAGQMPTASRGPRQALLLAHTSCTTSFPRRSFRAGCDLKAACIRVCGGQAVNLKKDLKEMKFMREECFYIDCSNTGSKKLTIR